MLQPVLKCSSAVWENAGNESIIATNNGKILNLIQIITMRNVEEFRGELKGLLKSETTRFSALVVEL